MDVLIHAPSLTLAAGAFGAQQVISLLIGIGLLLGLARLLGEIARKLGQPMVLGELLAGIVLGQTILGQIYEPGFLFLFPQDTGDPNYIALQALIVLSATLLLLVAGLEVELSTALKQGKAAALVAMVGMFVPASVAFAAGWFKPDWMGGLAGETPNHLAFALFCGIALSITALPVIAKILIDLKMFKSDMGMLIMSAAMLNDMAGWLGFAVVLALIAPGAEQVVNDAVNAAEQVSNAAAQAGPAPKDGGNSGGGGPSIWNTLLLTLGFIALMMTVVRIGFHKLLPYIQAHWSVPGGVIAFVMVVTFLCSAATEWIGVHAIFGAFIAGVAIGDSHHLRPRTRETIHEFITNIFAPLFFASVGLSVNFFTAFSPITVIIAVFVACIGKVTGCFLGGRLAGMGKRDSMAVGCGMVAQGTMGVILGQLALDAGLINDELFVAIVVVALLTSFAAGPAMQKVLGLKAGKSLGDMLSDATFIPLLASRDRRGAIEELVNLAAERAELDAKQVFDTVWKREEIMHTGLGDGIAVPHARLAGIEKPIVAVGRSEVGIDFEASDGKPANLICLLLTPAQDHTVQVELLRMVAVAFRTPAQRERAMNAADYTQFLAALRAADSEDAHG